MHGLIDRRLVWVDEGGLVRGPRWLHSVRRLNARVLAPLAVVADDGPAEGAPEDGGQRAEDDGRDPERLLRLLEVVNLGATRVGAEERAAKVLVGGKAIEAGVGGGGATVRGGRIAGAAGGEEDLVVLLDKAVRGVVIGCLRRG